MGKAQWPVIYLAKPDLAAQHHNRQRLINRPLNHSPRAIRDRADRIQMIAVQELGIGQSAAIGQLHRRVRIGDDLFIGLFVVANLNRAKIQRGGCRYRHRGAIGIGGQSFDFLQTGTVHPIDIVFRQRFLRK